MNNDIGSLLLNLETLLVASNGPILQHLECGLSDAEIARYETETGIVFSPEFRELFKWKNGTRLSDLLESSRCSDSAYFTQENTSPTATATFILMIHWKKICCQFSAAGVAIIF